MISFRVESWYSERKEIFFKIGLFTLCQIFIWTEYRRKNYSKTVQKFTCYKDLFRIGFPLFQDKNVKS